MLCLQEGWDKESQSFRWCPCIVRPPPAADRNTFVSFLCLCIRMCGLLFDFFLHNHLMLNWVRFIILLQFSDFQWQFSAFQWLQRLWVRQFSHFSKIVTRQLEYRFHQLITYSLHYSKYQSWKSIFKESFSGEFTALISMIQ